MYIENKMQVTQSPTLEMLTSKRKTIQNNRLDERNHSHVNKTNKHIVTHSHPNSHDFDTQTNLLDS